MEAGSCDTSSVLCTHPFQGHNHTSQVRGQLSVLVVKDTEGEPNFHQPFPNQIQLFQAGLDALRHTTYPSLQQSLLVECGGTGQVTLEEVSHLPGFS